MLSSLVKEHQGRQVARKEQQEVNKLLTVLLFVFFRDENNLDQLQQLLMLAIRRFNAGEKKRGTDSCQQPHNSTCGSP